MAGGGANNNNVQQLAGAMAAGGQGGDKAFHIDMQQQVITSANGFKINVIRLMQHEGAVHVDAVEELKKIEVKDDDVMENSKENKNEAVENSQENDNGDGDKTVENSQDGTDNNEDTPDKFRIAVGETKEDDIAEAGDNYAAGSQQENTETKMVSSSEGQKVSVEVIQDVESGETKTVVERIQKIQVQASEDALEDVRNKRANPPESIFNKLKPSGDRYTILGGGKDEL